MMTEQENTIRDKVAEAANKLFAAITFYLQEPSDEQVMDIQELAGALAVVAEREVKNNPDFARLVISANARRSERDALQDFDVQQHDEGSFVDKENDRRGASHSDQTPHIG
jgi:hypothetical protein